MPSMPRRFAVLAGLAAVATAAMLPAPGAMAQGRPGQPPQMFIAGTGPDELWEMTVKMDMGGMSMPARTTQFCKRKDAGKESLATQNNKDCTVSDMKTSGNRTTFTMTCTGEHPMTGRMDVTATADTYDGKMDMKSTAKGQEFEMRQTMQGRRIGACTDQSQQAVAAMKKQGDDMAAQGCAQMAATLNPDPFFGPNASCAAHKQVFCNNVKTVAAKARKSTGYRDAVGNGGPYVEKGFAACGEDLAATRLAACADGVATRNWSFVANGTCDADVRTVGESNCKGRSFTGMDRSLVPLCSRYASLMRGNAGMAAQDAQGQAAARAAAAQPQPSQQNPIDAGVNAVRKLLPF